MQMDADNAMRFCPFCGAATKLPEDFVDLAKFTMKHEETVRQTKVKEKAESEKRTLKFAVIWFGAIFAIIGLTLFLTNNAERQTEVKLENIIAEVQQLVADGNYDEALLKAQTIRVEKDGLFDGNYRRWENQRKDLIRLIKKKQKEAK